MTLRTVFFGTPPFAVPALEALAEVSEVVGVVCQPDRRSGRGMKMRAPAVKEAALALALSVHQPTRVRSGELERWLRDRALDVAVVAAYGRILPSGVLAAPRLGCINLHASLLPDYRGAAPIHRALLEGKLTTGISLMQMDEGMDTGPVFARRAHPISPEVTGAELTRELSLVAGAMVKAELMQAIAGDLQSKPQDDSLATSAPPVGPEDFEIDWAQSATHIERQVRTFAPSPGAATVAEGKRFKVTRARVGADANFGPTADLHRLPLVGRVSVLGGGVWVECGAGRLEILEGKIEGRRAQPAKDLVNGRVLEEGLVLGAAQPAKSS